MIQEEDDYVTNHTGREFVSVMLIRELDSGRVVIYNTVASSSVSSMSVYNIYLYMLIVCDRNYDDDDDSIHDDEYDRASLSSLL